jgi:hypothetical protein
VIRRLAASPVGLLAFAAGLALTAFAVRRGLLADDAIALWAGAIGAGGGQVPIGRIVASYPTLPFFASTLVELVMPSGTPAPALLAAGLLALLSGAWFLAFRNAGLSAPAAVGATLLIALHPAMLAACLAGAADMVLAAFLYLFARGLFDLRARTAAPEVMVVGLALLGLAFSHPIGAAVVFAAIPALVFAVRPQMVANSALNVVLALLFPTIFALGAFAYVSWVFPGAGWSFLAAPAESLAGWAADAAKIARDLTGSLALDAALAVAAGLALGAPFVPIALGWVRERRPLIAPPVVFAASAVAAAAITVATGLFGHPAPLAAAGPILAAVTVARVPLVRERSRAVLALLAAGWLGGTIALALIEPRAPVQVSAALDGAPGEQSRLDALALGGATLESQGVLVDTDNAPAVVVGRGRASGLIAPHDGDFALALLFGRIDAPFVAVPDPYTPAGVRDRLNKAFPRLYRDGAPGYRLAYRNKTWRLYARQTKQGDRHAHSRR